MSARTVHCKHCKHFIRQRPQDGIWIHVGTNRAVCSWAEPREGHQKPGEQES